MAAVTIFQLIIAVYVITMCIMLYNGSWFCYHPIFMIIFFFGLLPDAIFKIIKFRKKMYYTHMYSNIIGCLFAFAGLYVIYTNKISMNKQHFITNHGKLGITILICIPLQIMFSYFKLHPSQPVLDRKPYRNYHINFGKGLLIASFIESMYGLYIIANKQVLIIASSLTLLYLLSLVLNIKRLNRFIGITLYESE